MVSGTVEKKLRVAWICHFHDEFLNEFLRIHRKTENFAPWIIELIKMFESEQEIELYIIAPHKGIKKDQRFKRNGITYYFYSVGLPFSNKFNLNIYDFITNYIFLKRKVKKYINEIKPEIIHLHGAENPYYSSTILQFNNKYPILTSIQGFISLTKSALNFKIRNRIKIERSILTVLTHFGVRTVPMSNEIKKYNPNSKLHWHLYPVNMPESVQDFSNVSRIFDCIYFAKISKDKGIEDLIEAINILKDLKPEIKLLIIGGGESKYISFLKERCKILDLEKNIDWIGFLPSQYDVYDYCKRTKISILPTYNDIIPGTIIESMFLKTAVVSYSVGGIPEINRYEEVVKLVEPGNISQLTDEIYQLLLNDRERELLAEKAYQRAKDMFVTKNITTDLINIYHNILTNNNFTY